MNATWIDYLLAIAALVPLVIWFADWLEGK
jgi:hypothetical protein